MIWSLMSSSSLTDWAIDFSRSGYVIVMIYTIFFKLGRERFYLGS
jgi:hypothetical protein